MKILVISIALVFAGCTRTADILMSSGCYRVLISAFKHSKTETEKLEVVERVCPETVSKFDVVFDVVACCEEALKKGGEEVLKERAEK